MKTALLNITILSLLFVSDSYSQFYADSVTPNYITELMQIADKTITYKAEYRNPKDFTEKELKHIAELYFKCYDEDPVGVHFFLEEVSQPFYRMYEEDRKVSKEAAPILKVNYLRNQIADKYGIAFSEILSIPALLRCKYISDNLSFLDTVREISTSMKVEYIFYI